MTRAAVGSIAGSSAPRADNRPNMRGAMTVERNLKAGTRLWLAGVVEANYRRGFHLDQCRSRQPRRTQSKTQDQRRRARMTHNDTTDLPITEEEIQRMPWTCHLMTAHELQWWVASRKDAGRIIDIETCELGRWYASDLDPYGVSRDPDLYVQVGTNRFVRSPESNGWISEKDLPVEKFKAMYDRIHREFEARAPRLRVVK
jgi:hypothetical protein